MPWQIRNGKPVKVTPEVHTGVGPAEVPTVTQVVEDFSCPVCGRSYKTEAGRDSHVDDKHTADPLEEE